MDKTAIVVFSDPKSGSEEALGRLVNALILTHELKRRGQETALIFQGAGVRWAAEVVKPDHPANGLYREVQSAVVGACAACASVFGATEEIAAAGGELVAQTEIPGLGGVIDLAGYVSQGYRLVTF